ncbi:hypothetical protein [Natrinema sp. J7-2]|uniref:hypothetical protein n=1 Tax=Natrinema sp. (strain J7-2) TaxID=406552 RepID=UPI001E644132|nr:hypothetical protein [Natrinema sp. J7-2]
MTERIEFGSKAAADQFRDEYADHLCSNDDRRLKTVAISSDAPDHVLETATIEAAAGRSERGGRGGQAELTDHERESIDFSRTTVPPRQEREGVDARGGRRRLARVLRSHAQRRRTPGSSRASGPRRTR